MQRPSNLFNLQKLTPTVKSSVQFFCSFWNIKRSIPTSVFVKNFATIEWLCNLGVYYQKTAATKGINADRCHTVGDGDSCHAAATLESPLTNVCHAIGYGNGGQAAATLESPLTNVCHAVGDGDGCKATAIPESTTTNGCYAIFKNYFFNIVTYPRLIIRIIPHGSHTTYCQRTSRFDISPGKITATGSTVIGTRHQRQQHQQEK